jgi:GDP-L-fucose synthase
MFREGKWADSRVVVVGGGGFLGGHVARLLTERGCAAAVPRTADGWDFRRLDDARRFFDTHRPEVVFNCAARQGGLAYQAKYPGEIYYDNMLMGLQTMEAARLAGVAKYVNVVAACSYPGVVDGLMREADYWGGPLHPSVVNYGFTKKAQVVQSECYRRQYGFVAISLLLANLYGPEDDVDDERSHALMALLRRFWEAKRRGRPEVVVWGSGNAIREWLYVEDAAEAVVAAERIETVEPLNVGVGEGHSIRALAERIAALVGYEGRIVFDTSRPEGAAMKTLAIDRFVEATGWRPGTTLDDGLARTLSWIANR